MEAIIGREFPTKVIPLIDNAKTEIKIVVFDWRWYPNDPANPCQLFNQSIARAVKRGVSVFAVANSNDVIGILSEIGVQAKKLATKNLMHAKMIIIDQSIIVIGSHNYTQSAFTMNYEISVIFNDATSAKDFLKFFNSIF